jgi:hypothetical protein
MTRLSLVAVTFGGLVGCVVLFDGLVGVIAALAIGVAATIAPIWLAAQFGHDIRPLSFMLTSAVGFSMAMWPFLFLAGYIVTGVLGGQDVKNWVP